MSRATLAQAIADIAADYGPRPLQRSHVEQWVAQFPDAHRDAILRELHHVLQKTYFSRQYFVDYFASLARHKSLPDPERYWRGVSFLRLQQVGNSQKDLLELFSNALQEAFGFGVNECGHPAERYVYLDDALFSGGRIKSDLIRWINQEAPQNAKVDVLLVARHTQGCFFAEGDIARAAEAAGKNIALRFLARLLIEDRKARTNVSDVLRPTSLPHDPAVLQYAANLKSQPVLRVGVSVGPNEFFSSNQGRTLLEQQFLTQGVRVRAMCPLLKNHHRPLGSTVQHTLGFGSLIVTYRNCPNNAPLALWAGNPWYPLFPRETN